MQTSLLSYLKQGKQFLPVKKSQIKFIFYKLLLIGTLFSFNQLYAQTEGGSFKNLGSSTNQHNIEANVVVWPWTHFDSTKPEGALVVAFNSLRHYDGSDNDIYNIFGIWATNVKLYSLDQTILRTDITTGIGYGVSNANIVYNIPAGGNDVTGVGYVNLGDIGPNRNYNFTFLHNYGRDGSGYDKDRDFYGNRSGTTAKLKAPTNVKYVDYVDETKHQVFAQLTWEKGTNYIDNFVGYEISRKVAGGTFQVIATVSGDKRSYIDNSLTTSGSYVYSVRTVLSSAAPSDWNRASDAYEPAVETTFTFNAITLTATTDQANRIRVTWPTISNIQGLETIVLYRNGEELTQLSKNVKTYNDSDIIPGLYYTYNFGVITDGVSGADYSNWRSNSTEGKSLPNGKISGYIKGRTNAGVEGVVLTAISKTTISDNKTTQTYTYTDTTDASGYYEISNVFYGNGANYGITPTMPGYTKKRFDPETLTRKLSYDDANKQNVDFTDTASFAISGKVYFASIKDSLNRDIFLPLQDGEVWLDGKNSSAKTKSDGTYNIGITTPGTHTIQIKYKNHPIDFDDALAPNVIIDTVKSVVVNKLIADFNFINRKTDTLTIKVAASCDAPIGEYVVLKLNSAQTGFANGNVVAKYNKKLYVSSYDWDKGSPKNPGQAKMGEIKVILPATGFEGQVTEVRENSGINSNKLEYFTRTYNLLKVNLAQGDTTTNVKTNTTITTVPADTSRRPDGSIYKITPSRQDTTITNDTTRIVSAPKMEFVYHDKLQLSINNGNPAFADSVRFNPPGVYKYLLTQNDKHLLNVKIRESYAYRGVTYNCVLDTGNVYVYDAISDVIDRQDFKLDSLTHDVKYVLKVGAPILEAPYQKTIQIVGKVGSRQTSQIITAVVEGERARNATFVTKTPEVPLFVLHDPPGDNSYATISKGTSVSISNTTQYNIGGGGGIYLDSKLGAGLTLPIIGSTGAAFHVQAEIEAGADKTKSTTTNYTTTFTEDFSTSSEETLVGKNGDVFVGASMNVVYALTDVLKYDASKQNMVRDTSLAIQNNGFNTTFAYTRYHIKNILLKQLGTLYGISKSKFDIAKQKYDHGDISISKTVLEQLNRDQLEYYANIQAWKTTLVNDSLKQIKATPVKLPNNMSGIVNGNISFSAGAIYDNSFTSERDTTTFQELNIYLNAEVRAGIYNVNGDFRETDIGGLLKIRYNNVNSKETQNSHVTTTSYHLEDNDLGDFLSVGLAEDKEYGTPVFNIVSGSSSCPHEDNTQYRHLPAMQITGANEQRNVPSDQAAKFEILISNRSESDETVEYAIKLDPLSNPNGARVLVGGQDVTSGQATYYIPTGKGFKLPVEVFRGPLSSVYENLSLVIFSTCDNTLDDISEANIAKPSVKINAYFQNKCSEIDLFVPGNNWLVNQSNSNKLFVAFSKYDASAASPLTSVGLQYRKINQDYENSLWSTVATFPKSALLDKYYDYTFDVSTLPDGKYEIRAIAVCQGVDVNYSPVYSGIIDRVSAVAFGLPTPANGILTNSEVVGLTFNKDIVYTDQVNPVKVTLKRKDNGQLIPATIIGDGRTFIVKTIPESAINDYENVELTATVKNLTDLNGNKVADSVSWSFVVNLSPVYWKPANIIVNATENVQSNFSAKLMNKSALAQNFTLVKYPTWLTPSYKTGKLVAQGEQNIDFSIDKNLNTGTYADTVIVLADNKRQLLYVTVNVLRTPPTWVVNPANYKYNMSFTAQFSLNNTDTLTSIDVRDKMGVFVGDECRGVANIEYDRNTQKYVAYITAYANNATNENLTVRFWDTYPGIEYQGLERVSFVPNGIVGNANNPYILHPEGVYQTIPLKKGWTWVSLNVKNADMSIKKVLKNLKPTDGDVIKAFSDNNPYSQYDATLGWAGKLDSMNVYNSYMIYVAKPDTIRVLGQFVTQNVNVQLKKGWSWTGYPMAINMELSNYLKNYKPTNGSQIISQEEFAQYNAVNNTWSGSLKYMRPGKGYKFYSGADGFTIPVVTYTPQTTLNPTADVVPINNPATSVVVNNNNAIVNSSVYNNTSVNTTNYENNMSLTSVINQGGKIVNNTTNRYETYVYVENKLVNIVNQTTLSNGQTVGFIPVAGNTTEENKPVVVKVYDKEEQKEYSVKVEQPIIQQTDKIIGTIAKPVVLVLEGSSNIQVNNLVSKRRVNIGDTILYTLKFKNIGPDLAVNTTLVDTLSQAFDFVSATNDVVYDAVKRTITINKLQVASAEENQYQIVLKALAVGNQIIGKGKATVNNDIDLSNNNFAKLTMEVVDRKANVTVQISVNKPAVNKNDNLEYSIKVVNNGPDMAKNIILQDVLPPAFKFVSATNGLTYTTNGSQLTASLVSLATGSTFTYKATLIALNPGNQSLGNGKVDAENDNNLDFNNNQISPVAVKIVENGVDLLITNALEKNTVDKGEPFIYTIKVKNNGPDDAQYLKLTDILPIGFDFVSSASPQLSFDAGSKTLSANIDELKNGSELEFKVTLKATIYGNLSLGNGKVDVNNETNTANNQLLPISIIVADKRTSDARIIIPTLFTPNGDGINDVFEIPGLNEFYISNTLTIYNKAYNVVYKKQNYSNDWGGDQLPMGSYGYILKAIDKNGKEVNFKGFVTIIYQ